MSSILKTTQLEQAGIRSILDLGMRSNLRRTLETQLEAYNTLETEVHMLATQRGWELKDLDPAHRFVIDVHSRAKINGKKTDSLIADMVIQRSTKGMIRSYKQLNQLEYVDYPVQAISKRLLDQETAIIQQMKSFL